MYQQVLGTASEVSATIVATDPLPLQQRLAVRSLLTNDLGQVWNLTTTPGLACMHARWGFDTPAHLQDGVLVLVDTREGGRNHDLQLAMCQHLAAQGVTYRTETLPFGDYLYVKAATGRCSAGSDLPSAACMHACASQPSWLICSTGLSTATSSRSASYRWRSSASVSTTWRTGESKEMRETARDRWRLSLLRRCNVRCCVGWWPACTLILTVLACTCSVADGRLERQTDTLSLLHQQAGYAQL